MRSVLHGTSYRVKSRKDRFQLLVNSLLCIVGCQCQQTVCVIFWFIVGTYLIGCHIFTLINPVLHGTATSFHLEYAILIRKAIFCIKRFFMFSVRYKYQWANFRISAPIAHIFALPRWYNSSHIAIIAGLNLMSHNDARLSFARISGGPIFIPLTSDWSTWILFNWHYSGKDSGLFCCFEMTATQNDQHIQTQQKTNRFYWYQ